MIQLRTSQLKEFARLSSQIQENKLYPILSYIKVDSERYITKSNMEIVLRMRVEFLMSQTSIFIDTEPNSINEPIMVHEKTLFGLVNSTKSEIISISTNEVSGIISDGKTEVKYPLAKVSDYPATPILPEKVDFVLDNSMIDTIKIAKSFCSTDESHANFQAVHIKDNYIAGINFHSFFIKEFEQTFPNIILVAKHVNIINQFDLLQFSESDNHYFFKLNNDLVYSFTKTEYATPQLDQRLIAIKKLNDKPHFIMSKPDILDFCVLANNVSTDDTNVSYLTATQDGVTQIILPDASMPIKKNISVEGEANEFYFNHKSVLQPILAIPVQKLKCIVESYTLVVSFDNSFACFIGLSKL